MSFLTPGIFWVGQQTQLNHLARSQPGSHLDPPGVFIRGYARAVFDTIADRLPLVPHRAFAVLGEPCLLLGAVLFFSWGDATSAGLVKRRHPDSGVALRVWRAAVHGQYLLGHRFVALVQLNYAIGLVGGKKK